jgi:hypothetical protein
MNEKDKIKDLLLFAITILEEYKQNKSFKSIADNGRFFHINDVAAGNTKDPTAIAHIINLAIDYLKVKDIESKYLEYMGFEEDKTDFDYLEKLIEQIVLKRNER